jgi:tRNA (guanine-N7-)-methyltransferase
MSELLPAITLSTPTDPAAHFPTSQPLVLEIGFGGGEHVLAQAASNPGVNHIGAEVFANGIASLLSRLWAVGAPAPHRPANLALWTEDVRPLLSGLPAGCLTRIDLLYPDPWPKARHAERRMVNPQYLAAMHAALAPGGELFVASDHPVYQPWVDQVMAESPHFALLERTGTRPAGRIETRYEAKARREGRTPVYWTFRRC